MLLAGTPVSGEATLSKGEYALARERRGSTGGPGANAITGLKGGYG